MSAAETGRSRTTSEEDAVSVVSHPYPEGTLLRADYGDTFEVEDYVSAEEADDGIAFYWGSRNGGMNNITVPADRTELVKTAQQMRSRKVPTCEAVAAGLDLLGTHDLFEPDETEVDGDTVTVYAETNDGLRIAVEVKVVGVTRTDF